MKHNKCNIGVSGKIMLRKTMKYLIVLHFHKLLMSYIRKNDFKLFGIYRILLGVIVVIFFAVRAIMGLQRLI